MLSKKELRRRLLRNRRQNPEKDKKIFHNLLSLKEFMQADLILTYISTETEIDTRMLINYCLEAGRRIAVPRTGAEEMQFHEIKSFEGLFKSSFGILEPSEGCSKAQLGSNSFCVVPALACDTAGFRVGYGKGFYDRFLKNYSGKSAALCYFENITELPTEPHDIAVWAVITDREIYYGR